MPSRAGPAAGTVSLGLSSRGGSGSRRRPNVGGVTIAVHPSQALSLSVRCARGSPTWCSPMCSDNAVKFSPPGGQVVIETAAEGAAVVVAVSDAGPGIPGRRVPRVFERLLSWSRREGQRQPGLRSGAGHFPSRRREHGGQMSVESAAGCGATLRMRLPLRLIVGGARSPRRPRATIAGRPSGFPKSLGDR